MSSKASVAWPSASPTLTASRASDPGAVEVDRVGAAAAAADRQVEAGEAVLELAGEAGGGAGEALVVLGGDDHGEVGGAVLAGFGGRQRARGQRAQRPHRQGQHPLAPVAGLRRARRRPQHQHAGAAVEVGAELGAAGDDVAAVGHLAGEDGVDEGAARPPRSPIPARASAPAPAPAASSPCGRSPGRAASRRGSAARRPRRRRPAARPWSPRRRRRAAAAPGRGRRRRRRAPRWSGRSGRRWRRAGGPRRAPPRAARRPIRPLPRARRAGRDLPPLQHFRSLSSSPACASLSRPARSPGRRLLAVDEVEDVVVVVDDRQPDHDAADQQRGEHEEREEAGRGLLPDPAVRAQRRG